MADVFLSCSHSDAGRVRPLVSLLEAQGCNVWWDRDIRPGSNFEQEIKGALANADWVLVALTENASNSDWVRAEATVGGNHNKVIPVLLDDVAIPLSLSALKVADLRRWPSDPEGAEQLIDTIVSNDAHATNSRSNVFIGRESTLTSLQSGFDDVSVGNGHLIMVSGEPGIGKTRCIEEFSQLVEDQGGLVLWGRCHEQQGAPPYWPWVQILRDYADANADDELRVALAAGGDQICTFLPEVYERLGIARRSISHENNSDETFRLFDSISRLFAYQSTNSPLVLIVDDLHWADASSLSLLEFLVKDLRRQPLLMVCAYRDAEVTRKSPLLATLGELTRVGRTQRVRLGGLNRDDTAQLIKSVTRIRLPQAVFDSIFEQTDGNPLFVSEVAKVIADEHATATGNVLTIDVPDGVREAIGRRLDRLSALSNELLVIASVIGREFDLNLIVHASGMEMDACLDELDQAVRAGLVENQACSPTAFQFTHAVIRETMYEELSTLERLKIHQQIAASLTHLHQDALAPVLSQLVHHYVEASVLGEHETAIKYCMLAAEQSERIYAFEEAARHYQTAIRLLVENKNEDDPRITHAHYRNGCILRSLGKIEPSMNSLTCGIAIARQQRDTEMFRRCVLARVFVSSHLSQEHNIPLLQEALSHLPESDTANRASVLAHLAFALRSADTPARVEEVGAQAIALARQANDKAVLAEALQFTIMALRGQACSLDHRVELGVEMVELSGALDESEEVAEHWYLHLLNLIEAGKTDAFNRLLTRYDQYTVAHQLGRHQYQASLLRSALHLLRGEWQIAGQRIEAALAQGQKLNRQEAEAVYGAQMFMLNRDLGGLQQSEPVVRRMLSGGHNNLWTPGTMLFCSEVGLQDEARMSFERLAANEFTDVPTDEMWTTCMVFCAITCTRLGDINRAETLYQLLVPFDGQTANHPTAVCYGSIATYLGMLAETTGHQRCARTHYEQGASENRTMGAWPALIRSELALAQLLVRSEDPADVETGLRLLPDLEQLATRFEMPRLAADIGSMLSDSDSELPDGLTPREIEVLKLLAIGRSNKDISLVLSISLSTVATHVRSILNKTQCANRTEAAAYAMRHELSLINKGGTKNGAFHNRT